REPREGDGARCELGWSDPALGRGSREPPVADRGHPGGSRAEQVPEPSGARLLRARRRGSRGRRAARPRTGLAPGAMAFGASATDSIRSLRLIDALAFVLMAAIAVPLAIGAATRPSLVLGGLLALVVVGVC